MRFFLRWNRRTDKEVRNNGRTLAGTDGIVGCWLTFRYNGYVKIMQRLEKNEGGLVKPPLNPICSICSLLFDHLLSQADGASRELQCIISGGQITQIREVGCINAGVTLNVVCSYQRSAETVQF